ncbi:MAG: hypothetical protein COB36_10940 [Alphaproteobacteria bacterium]|nr:MAG: hypothetical protein COB36_10940 [Alphaproteobacteria bacterium]
MCTAWKQAIDDKVDDYVADYKRQLLEALMREGVKEWGQVQRGLDATTSAFLPNVNDFAKQCMGGNEITGSWGTGAHKIYDKSKALPELKADPGSEKVVNSREHLNGLFT